jgi:Cu-Zn family superoxide dismutase
MKELLVLSIAVLLLLGCAASNEPIVAASLEPSCQFLECPTVHGMVHFQNMGDGSTEVHLQLTGVPPGEHGVHIYESGGCSGNGLNARHFNPMGTVHGAQPLPSCRRSRQCDR